jgi:hypothetical protein
MAVVRPQLAFTRVQRGRYMDRVAGAQRNTYGQSPDQRRGRLQNCLRNRKKIPNLAFDVGSEEIDQFMSLTARERPLAHVPVKYTGDFDQCPR